MATSTIMTSALVYTLISLLLKEVPASSPYIRRKPAERFHFAADAFPAL